MKKAFIDEKLCVACGCCLTACKVGAISIPTGTYAMVDINTCVGCGMCARKCPASIITVKEAASHEQEKMV